MERNERRVEEKNWRKHWNRIKGKWERGAMIINAISWTA